MPTKIYLYNTLTRIKEEFKPINSKEVRMYVCGPTVNDVPHLGHARQQITFDILRKTLEYNKLKVKFVSNITDVDDKIIKKANELNENIKELTKRNTQAHIEDYKKLNISSPTIQPKATEYIKEMIDLIKTLEKKEYTYEIKNDGIYYNTSKFKSYGKLSNQNLTALKKAKRTKEKSEKKNKEDFVLWKFSKEDEPFWESPWGNGRPGWHIECSAMSYKLLGIPFDIHGGGQDLTFPHHEDEIAQTEAAYGKKMCNFWIHNAMVNIDNVKMSKSLGNFRTIRDLLAEYSPETIRYFVLTTHYRKPIDFTQNKLEAAKTTIERIKRKISEIKKQTHKGIKETSEYEKEFLEALNDDLNTSKAIQIFIKVVDDFDISPKTKLKTIEKFEKVLSLNLLNFEEPFLIVSKEIENLVKQREKLRKEKKWAESDILRERIKERGFLVEDTPDGSKLSKL
jgi:cysteinyl-tRNA synthetase